MLYLEHCLGARLCLGDPRVRNIDVKESSGVTFSQECSFSFLGCLLFLITISNKVKNVSKVQEATLGTLAQTISRREECPPLLGLEGVRSPLCCLVMTAILWQCRKLRWHLFVCYWHCRHLLCMDGYHFLYSFSFIIISYLLLSIN